MLARDLMHVSAVYVHVFAYVSTFSSVNLCLRARKHENMEKIVCELYSMYLVVHFTAPSFCKMTRMIILFSVWL